MAPSADVRIFSRDTLFDALSNPHFDVAGIEQYKCAQYLAKYLGEIGAKTIVVEHNYTDGDYLDDFASFYVRCFRDYERRCKRLHFFNTAFDRGQFLRLLVGERNSDVQDATIDGYVGFVVARPLPSAVVGRTLLATYSSDGGRRHYPVTRSYNVNLHGIPLTVRSLPFEEQDAVVAACATVALWSAFHKTAEMFGSASPRPAKITRAATLALKRSRPIPSRGLVVEQICSAVADVGLEPEVVDIQGRGSIPLPSLMYGHLHMGLPVILGVRIEGINGLHAVVLTGYSLGNERHLATEVSAEYGCVPMVGLRLKEFYAHDDQVGPFARMVVNPGTNFDGNEYPVSFDGSWIDPETGKTRSMFPVVAVIPVYDKIRVPFLDVHAWAMRLNDVLESLLGKYPETEWNIYLTTTNEFKASLQRDEQMDRAALPRLMLTQFPRFLWRARFDLDGQPQFELIADATDMRKSLPIRWVLWYDQTMREMLGSLLNHPDLTDILTDTLTPNFLAFLRTSLETNEGGEAE